MNLFFTLTMIVSGLLAAQASEDKTVQWGYKVVYDTKLKAEDLRGLRKSLKAKGIQILYPPDKGWNLPTGFLSVSTYLTENEIKETSPLIHQVESAEKTQLLKITLRPDLDSRGMTRVFASFSNYKIQILTRVDELGAVKLTVKTILQPDQVKSLSELAPFIQSVEN